MIVIMSVNTCTALLQKEEKTGSCFVCVIFYISFKKDVFS